jgi:signal transduction histidine kinase
MMLDAEYISLSINNLMGNACDALRLAAKKSQKTKKITIETKLFKSKQYYTIDCSDNGTGIEDQHMPHIAEPFFSTRGTGGAGLGLAVVKKVIDAHGGLLRWQSTPTAGSTFSLTLPCDL